MNIVLIYNPKRNETVKTIASDEHNCVLEYNDFYTTWCVWVCVLQKTKTAITHCNCIRKHSVYTVDCGLLRSSIWPSSSLADALFFTDLSTQRKTLVWIFCCPTIFLYLNIFVIFLLTGVCAFTILNVLLNRTT